MTCRARWTALLTEGMLLATSATFLGWYLWTKLTLLPAGTWGGY